MAKAYSRRSCFVPCSRRERMSKAYNGTKVRQDTVSFRGPLELVIFMASLIATMALFLIALLLHL